MIAIAIDFNQPWSEVKAMTPIERKSFIYGAAVHRGCGVDWETGKIHPPAKRRDG